MRRAWRVGGMGGGVRVLGVDPGSGVTGWGVVEKRASRFHHLASGLIKPRAESLPPKLASIYEAIREVIALWHPTVACIEKSFVARNAQSALKLGEVRGVVALAAAQSELQIREYSPAEIKGAVTGYGRADKQQMQSTVARLLALPAAVEADRADALAAALCCLQREPMERLLAQAGARAGTGRRRLSVAGKVR